MQGPEALQHLLSIHFRAPGLSEHVRERPAMLYFTLGPASVAVAVAHDIPGGEWVLQVTPLPSGLWQGSCTAQPRVTHPGCMTDMLVLPGRVVWRL